MAGATSADLGLRNFVVVVREAKIHATSVDVDLGLEGSVAHSTALNVPARATLKRQGGDGRPIIDLAPSDSINQELTHHSSGLPFPKVSPTQALRVWMPSTAQSRREIVSLLRSRSRILGKYMHAA